MAEGPGAVSHYAFGWAVESLVDLQAGPEAPGARYVPVSERELEAFRLGGGGGPPRRVSFEGESGSDELVIPGPDGPVRLPRVP